MEEGGFDALMDEACATWGYCGCMKRSERLHVTMLIPASGPVHANQFVEWLLLADNVNPNLQKYERHKTALRAAFITHMGGEVIDAELLRWSDSGAYSDGPEHNLSGS